MLEAGRLCASTNSEQPQGGPAACLSLGGMEQDRWILKTLRGLVSSAGSQPTASCPALPAREEGMEPRRTQCSCCSPCPLLRMAWLLHEPCFP